MRALDLEGDTPGINADIAITKAGGVEHAFQLAHLEGPAVVKGALAHQAQTGRAPRMRPPAQKFQLVVRFGEHPAIGHRKVADAIGFHHPMNLEKMAALRAGITDMLDHVVGDDYIEAGVGERQFDTLHQPVCVAIPDKPVVAHVHRSHLATQTRVDGEVVRDAARTGADFQHAEGLRMAGKIEQALYLHGLPVARGQVEHGVWLAFEGVRVHAVLHREGSAVAAHSICAAIRTPNSGHARLRANATQLVRKAWRSEKVRNTALANAAQSPGATSRPDCPSATASTTPPVAKATVGRPCAAASTATMPKPSGSSAISRTGNTWTSAAR